MRNTPALFVTAALLAAGLTACTSTSASECVDGMPEGDAARLVSVSGPAGSLPKVDIPTPLYVDHSQRYFATTGSGTPVTGNQVITMNFAIYNGTTGEVLQSSADAGAQTFVRDGLPEPFRPALNCAQAGSRVVAVIDDDSQAAQGFDMVFLADINQVLPAHAVGKNRAVLSSGFPSVVSAPDGTPGITIPKSAAPEELKVATLIEGDGPELTNPETPVVIQSMSASWATRTIISSTWQTGAPQQASLGTVGPGLAEALAGQKIGSRVLAVIPPDKQAQAEGGNGSAIVYVVDILGELSQ